MLILILGFLAVLIVAMAVIDFRARRRGVRYRGIDPGARDARRQNEADLRTRSNHQDYGKFTGGSGF